NRASEVWVCAAFHAHAARIRAISSMNSTRGAPVAGGSGPGPGSTIRSGRALLALGKATHIGLELLRVLVVVTEDGHVADRDRQVTRLATARDRGAHEAWIQQHVLALGPLHE